MSETVIQTPFSVEGALAFAKKNKYHPDPLNLNLACCVDGRYPNYPNLPAIAMPGVEIGPLMAALAINHSNPRSKAHPNAIFLLYLEIIGGAVNFRFHTDNHSSKVAEGCSHFRLACERTEMYSLDHDDIHFWKKFYTSFRCGERLEKF